jgi:hypothetical protein
MTIEELIDGVSQHLATLGDGRDVRSDVERDAYRTNYDAAQRLVSTLRNAPEDVARAEQRRDAVLLRRDAAREKKADLERQLAEAPDHRTIADARARDKEHDRQWQLRQQLMMLAQGVLYSGPGVRYEPLDDLDARIAELTDRRDRARAVLDAAVRQAEQLLGVTTTA